MSDFASFFASLFAGIPAIPTRFLWGWALIICAIVVGLAVFCAHAYAQRQELKFSWEKFARPTSHDDETNLSEQADSTADTTQSSTTSEPNKSNQTAVVWHAREDFNNDIARLAITRFKRLSAVAYTSLLICLIAICVIIARPATIDRQSMSDRNHDIVLCLDVSGSALSYDSHIITAYSQLLKNLHGERIALSIFNSTSKTVFPLTDDYNLVQQQLNYAATLLSRVRNQTSIDSMSDEEYQQISDWLDGTQNIENSTSLIGDGLMSCAMMLPQFTRVNDINSGRTGTSNAESASRIRNNANRRASIILATDNVPSGQQTFTLDQSLKLISDTGRINVNAFYVGHDSSSQSDAALEMKRLITQYSGVYVDLQSHDTTNDVSRHIQSLYPPLSDAAQARDLLDRPGYLVIIVALSLCAFVWTVKKIRR